MITYNPVPKVNIQQKIVASFSYFPFGTLFCNVQNCIREMSISPDVHSTSTEAIIALQTAFSLVDDAKLVTGWNSYMFPYVSGEGSYGQ